MTKFQLHNCDICRYFKYRIRNPQKGSKCISIISNNKICAVQYDTDIILWCILYTKITLRWPLAKTSLPVKIIVAMSIDLLHIFKFCQSVWSLKTRKALRVCISATPQKWKRTVGRKLSWVQVEVCGWLLCYNVLGSWSYFWFGSSFQHKQVQYGNGHGINWPFFCIIVCTGQLPLTVWRVAPSVLLLSNI